MMTNLKLLKVSRGDNTAYFHGSWYRGPDTRFIPNRAELNEAGALDNFVLDGWGPEAPFITPKDRITSFGSCFAAHVTEFLYQNGYNVFCREATIQDSHLIRFGEGMVNTFAIRQQFEWGFGVKDFPEGLWFGPNKEIATPSEEQRQQTSDILHNTDVFIVTLGLSEIWYDKESGEAFWRAVPADLFDSSRHGFRVTSVEENRANLQRILELIRYFRPEAQVIVTLSPVPLMATFRPVSCLTANTVSKGTLRVAVDEFMRANTEDEGIFYYPAYEIVKEYFADAYEPDNRHPRPEVTQQVLSTFYRRYCLSGM